MTQSDNFALADELKKSKIFPSNLKEFLILAFEEGALDDEVKVDISKMIAG